jgi:hypothetical protein
MSGRVRITVRRHVRLARFDAQQPSAQDRVTGNRPLNTLRYSEMLLPGSRASSIASLVQCLLAHIRLLLAARPTCR